MPSLHDSFLDEQDKWRQLGDDYKACLMEKAQLEEALSAKRVFLRALKRKMEDWREGIEARRELKCTEDLRLLHKSDKRLAIIENLRAKRLNMQFDGRVALVAIEKRVRDKLSGAAGKKAFEGMLACSFDEDFSNNNGDSHI